MGKKLKSRTESDVKCCYYKHYIDACVNKQSIVLEGPERIHVAACVKNTDALDEYWRLYEDVSTLYHSLRRGLRVSNNGPCLGYRPDGQSDYQWLSYHTVLTRSLNFGRGLRHLGLKPKDFVGIYCKNRVEWELAEQALFPFSIISVPLFDTLGPTAVNFEISQARISTIVVEDEKKILSVLNQKPECLTTIIYIEELTEKTRQKASSELGVKLYTFTEVEKMGEEHAKEYPEQPPTPDDIALLNYTSGTTGNPRGALIAHKNMVAAVSSNLITFALARKELGPSDVIISFLPLAHVYEKLVENCALVAGSSIGFYRGEITQLMDDIKCLRPTVLPCVPRLLNRGYSKIMGGAHGSALKRFMLQRALTSKSKQVRSGVLRKNSFWDYMVFRKVQKAFGGRINTVLTGGAPAGAEVLDFFRCALGCTVLEGYGQTETAGTGCITHPHDTNGGHVGAPTVCCAVKLIDVPEMEYFSQDDQGEICMKGPHVARHYFKSPEETEDAVDEEGWIHTGDVGKWLPNGALKIIDRKKNIFKLSQGEYVAPEKVEVVYSRSQYVSQIFVYGNSTESCVVGIVVPNPEAFQKSHANEDIENICKDDKIKALILENLTKIGKECRLLSFEQVKDIYLHPKPFSVEEGALTPTLKIKRQMLKKLFANEIVQMYNHVNKSQSKTG